MDENLFGEPFDSLPKKATESEKKKRRWERAFQKWSNENGIEGYTHYGACGFGVICNYGYDNYYGNPCVRALTAMLREKRLTIDYDTISTISFENAFDAELEETK